MSDKRVLVRSSLAVWDIALIAALGGGLLVCAAVLWSQPRQVRGLFLIGGAILLLVAFFVRRGRIRQLLWVEDKGNGFVLAGRPGQGERFIEDSAVLTMAYLRNLNYERGVLVSVTRRFIVWLFSEDAQPEKLEMLTLIKPASDVDPMAGLIGRISTRLLTQARADFQAGQALLGERWSLENRQLTLRMKRVSSSCALDDVTAVDEVDEMICIWRRGQDTALARIPTKSANAHLLQQFLSEHLRNQPAALPASEGEFGRIIFERRILRVERWLFIIIALILLAFGASIVQVTQDLASLVLTIPFIALAIFLGWLAWRTLGAVLRCHEYGVYKSGIFGKRRLLYTELRSFSYSAVRRFTHHGLIYAGTEFKLTFEPAPEQKKKRIRHAVTLHNADVELDNLRDRVAGIIAVGMAKELAANQAVNWTAKLRILTSGIEFRGGGIFRRNAPATIPYSKISGAGIGNGYFRVWATGQKKPVVSESVSQANFFPGYSLFSSIAQGEKDA
jgi:hypothetical protein